jgi:hypothetical protein
MRGFVLYAIYSVAGFGFWVVIVKLERFFIREFDDILSSWWGGVLDYVALIAAPEVIAVLFIGACISGIGAGLANRFWS